MIRAAQKWADAMRSGCISRFDVRLSLISTIWQTLLYPLPALNLSKLECEQIMAPILQYCLPAMGFCRTFPRAVVFAPLSSMGVGIEHLFTAQEILHIKDLIFHTAYDTDTGILYRISLEILLLEVGVSSNLSLLDYDQLSILATPSLVKSTWKFLLDHCLHLEHDMDFSLPRTNDQPIMSLILPLQPSFLELVSIKRCHLYLRAYFVSDITDGLGTHLLDYAWMGRKVSSSRDTTWPVQGPPTRNDWEIWKKFLTAALLSRGRQLKQPLGPWLTHESTASWYVDPYSDQLHRKVGATWFFHHRIPRRSGRPSYSPIGSICHPPLIAHHAQVYTKGGTLVCSGHSPVITPSLPCHSTLQDFLFSSTPPSAHWCFQSLTIPPDDGLQLVHSIQENSDLVEALLTQMGLSKIPMVLQPGPLHVIPPNNNFQAKLWFLGLPLIIPPIKVSLLAFTQLFCFLLNYASILVLTVEAFC
jgi:hypothetical protein